MQPSRKILGGFAFPLKYLSVEASSEPQTTGDWAGTVAVLPTGGLGWDGSGVGSRSRGRDRAASRSSCAAAAAETIPLSEGRVWSLWELSVTLQRC